MRIKLTNHAKKRMKERVVTFLNIRTAINKPFATLPTKDPERKRIMAKIGKKTLDIIYSKKRNVIIIITVAWLTVGDRKICP